MPVFVNLLAHFLMQFIAVDGKSIHAFYYAWYGNVVTDGNWSHWNHAVLPHWTAQVNSRFSNIGQRYNPPMELHSVYYPALGAYSSHDIRIIRKHFQNMKDAQIDTVVVSWWGQVCNV